MLRSRCDLISYVKATAGRLEDPRAALHDRRANMCVPPPPARLEHGLHVEARAVLLGRLSSVSGGEERIELGDHLQLGVAVEQQRRVVRRCLAHRVERLEEGREVVDAPRVKEEAHDVRRLHEPAQGFA